MALGINTDYDFSAPSSATPAVGASKILKLVTASRAVVSNASGDLAASATTATEIGYVSGVTSSIQTQLNTLSGSVAATFPVVDTQTLVKGSGDATKLLRFEVDGFTTATTRVLTPPDANIIIAGSASALTSGRMPFVTTGGLLTDSASLTWNGTSLQATQFKAANGATFKDLSATDAVIEDSSGNRIFRGLSSFSPTFADSVTAAFFQIGGSAVNALFTTSGGTAFNRLGFISTNGTTFSDASSVGIIAPLGIITSHISTASKIGIVIKGAASQTADLQQWQNSAGLVLSCVDSSGRFMPGAAAGVDLASATMPFKDLWLAGASGTPASNNFRITGTATAARVVTLPDATITVAGSASTLTSGRIPFVTTGGLLTDYSNFLFDSATERITTGRLVLNSTTNASAILINARAYTGGAIPLDFNVDASSTGGLLGRFRHLGYGGWIDFEIDSSGRAMLDASDGGSPLVLQPNNADVIIGTAATPSARLDVRPGSAGKIGQIIKLAASATADAFQIQSSSAAILAKHDSTGALFLPQGGAAAATFVKTGGCITQNTTQTGNTAITETDLFSTTLAASTLGTNGDTIEFTASGTFATSASTNKQIRVKFGSTTIFDSGAIAATTAASWVLFGQIIRTGAATQKVCITLNTSSAALMSYANFQTSAETLSSALVLKITGQATLSSDVVGETFKVLFIPGN